MKILVRFNKNIAIPRQVKSFKLFDLGIVSTTIDDLLDSTTIEIDDQTLPILKINNSSFIEYYLINDLGLTPGYSYPYYTDDFMKEVTIGDLVLINNGQMGEENVQSDWNQINILADDFIKNKPELFSGDYNDLINTPALVTNHSELNLDDGTNPHGTTKTDVGLGNVPNLDTTNAVNNEHTHSNKIILDNTTESFITALKNAYDGAVSWVTTNGTNLLNHLSNNSNPHNVTKYQVGLGNADNTSDADKPISNATQTALNGKANTIHSHVISDVNGLQTALNSKLDKVTTSGVERAYIINSDGTQSTKPTSDFGTVKGTGTINRISKFTAGGTIGDSQIFDDGTKVGIGTTSPQARLDVRAQGALDRDIAFRVRNSTDTQNFLVVNGAGDVYNNGAKGVNTNTFFGENVGRNTTGGSNTAIGVNALQNNTTGNNNTAIGVSALSNNTTGGYNTAIGYYALQNNTTGGSNTAIGLGALQNNTTGGSNTAIGLSALQNNTTGGYNTAIGLGALLSNTTGDSNTAIGQSALQSNTTGGYNTAIGLGALLSNTTGIFNTAFGVNAGRYISDGSNQTITTNSIFLGRDTRALNDNETNQIVIGYNAIGLGSNSVVLGNTSITRTQLRGQVIIGSFASPPTGIEGAIYYDSIKKKHRGFNGTAWNDLY